MGGAYGHNPDRLLDLQQQEQGLLLEVLRGVREVNRVSGFALNQRNRLLPLASRRALVLPRAEADQRLGQPQLLIQAGAPIRTGIDAVYVVLVPEAAVVQLPAPLSQPVCPDIPLGIRAGLADE